MIQIGNTIILNGDSLDKIKDIDFTDFRPLTCGLSLRSTVTASSIGEDGFTYCLQRSIFTTENKELFPQEFNVFWSEKPDDIYPYLAIVTLLLICGVPTELFKFMRF